MAQVTIERAVVSRIFGRDDQGASVYEEKTIPSGKRKGETIKVFYTLWNKGREPFMFDEGDVIENISGELSVTLDSYEDKETGDTKYVARTTVNDAVCGSVSSAGDDYDEDSWD